MRVSSATCSESRLARRAQFPCERPRRTRAAVRAGRKFHGALSKHVPSGARDDEVEKVELSALAADPPTPGSTPEKNVDPSEPPEETVVDAAEPPSPWTNSPGPRAGDVLPRLFEDGFRAQGQGRAPGSWRIICRDAVSPGALGGAAVRGAHRVLEKPSA